MAAKRLRPESDDHQYDEEEPEKSEQKKLRALPSFSTVIKEAMIQSSMQNLFAQIEPLIRKVIQEELERILLHSTVSIQRSPQAEVIKERRESPSFHLVFQRPVNLPIFTGSKVEDIQNSPLQIILMQRDHNGENSPFKNPTPIRLQVVVLDGGFLSEAVNDTWTSEEFEKNIVKERTGKRPLLTRVSPVILRDGVASVGELSFTDNSSWIRSQHFRIGVRVAQEGYKGPRIKEVMTEAFRVKDHRGELYKKNYPPALTDEVWRLDKIGKDGAFHTRLSAAGINTVHDFLKLWAVNRSRLRQILGQGMSDRVWNITVNHARTCPIGQRLYVHCRPHCTVLFSAICEVMGVSINGAMFSYEELNNTQRAYVQEMVHEAYLNFDSLQEAQGMPYNTCAMQDTQSMPQGANEASSWYPSDEIQVEDIDEAEMTSTFIHWGPSL